MNTNTTNIMEAGFECLIEKLGYVDAQRFIVEIKRDSFDYTKWHRNLFEDMTVDEIIEEAVAFEESHPYKGNGKRV